MKILVIEDEKDVRESILDILFENDYETIEATDGNSGLQSAIKNKPDLILCDITMPKMDGYHVLEEIRKISDLKLVPFIFLSAKSERGDVRKGMNMSADDYITKPFKKHELLDAIQARFSRIQDIKKQLSEKLNSLAINLHDSINQKTEIRHIELQQQLIDLNTTLKTSLSQMDNSQTIISKEARIPLSNILGFVDLIKQGFHGHPELTQELNSSAGKLSSAVAELDSILHKHTSHIPYTTEKIQKEIKNILLVDDEAFQHTLNINLIQKFDPAIEVVSLLETKEAIHHIKSSKEKPDLIFLDILISNQQGWVFLKELEKLNIKSDVIILSSSIDPDDPQKAKSFQMVKSFLAKPLTMVKLKSLFD